MSCINCPVDYSLVTLGSKTKCLKYATKAEISSAVTICEKDGTKPPLPKGQQENADLLAFFFSKRNRSEESFALDLNDVETESKFVNSIGEKALYTNWYRNEPDNKNNNQHYVVMWDDGQWNDYPGDFATTIICQLDCKKSKLVTSYAF